MASYFEGWYFKHQKAQDTFAVIAGRGNDHAFIQVITQERAYYTKYPLSAYHKSDHLQIADSVFTPDGIFLSIHQKDIDLSGSLRYGRLTPIQGDIMGPFRFFPMQCRHGIVSMNHRITGSVCLNGKDMEFTGGKGYIEGDSGRSFPKSYTWVQCSDFDSDCSIMASAAHIPFACFRFWGCICVVLLDGIEYRLATYNGAKILHRDSRKLVLAQKDLTLRILFSQPGRGYSLAAPVKGKMARNIREVPAAPAYFEFSQGNRILFQEKSLFASYEFVE